MVSGQSLLEVRDLQVEFRIGRDVVHAVNGASFTVHAGETAAILGESGSGKSVSAAAIMRVLPMPPALVAGGTIRFDGVDVLNMPMADWRSLSGRRIAMVFQDALAALNPVFSAGWQIAETFRAHGSLTKRERWDRAVRLMERVGIPAAADRARDYPHQFSGGMRQRVMIAMAIALQPELLIADEPTTALDVTVQAQIMDLLKALKEEAGMAMILITHDLGVVADVADTVAVMYAGRVVEKGRVQEVLRRPSHPYTLALMRSAPQTQRKGQKLRPIQGSPPDLADLPPGCAFHPRCEFARAICRQKAPEAAVPAPGRMAECHFAREVFDGTAA